jgi:predicted phosphodiesterase
MERIVIVSDLQIPYHDPRAVHNLIDFIKRYKPDRVVSIGDEIDLPQVSKWERGRIGEYAGTIGKDRDATVKILEQLRVTDVIRSNHTDRLFNYIASYAPGLYGIPELQLENFLRLSELGITYHKKPMVIAPGWVAVHGDHGRLSQIPGQTALKQALQHGKSLVCGHTHRLGLTHATEASGGIVGRILSGLEVGNLMDFKKAHYTHGSANWQQGFGLLYVDGRNVTPVAVPVQRDGSFIVEGKRYG